MRCVLLALPSLCAASQGTAASWQYTNTGTTTCELGKCYIKVGESLQQSCTTGFKATASAGTATCSQYATAPANTVLAGDVSGDVANTCQAKTPADCDIGGATGVDGINLWRVDNARARSRVPGTCSDVLASGSKCTIECAAGYTQATGTSGEVSCAAGVITQPTLACLRCEVANFAAGGVVAYDPLSTTNDGKTSENHGWSIDKEHFGWNSASPSQKIQCDQTFGIGNWDWTSPDEAFHGMPTGGLPNWAPGQPNLYQGSCFDHQTKICNGRDGPIKCNGDLEDCIAVDANKWNEYDWTSPCSDKNLLKECNTAVMFPYTCPGTGHTDTQKQTRRDLMMRGNTIGVWRTQPWEVCGPRRTAHAEVKIIAVPVVGTFFAVVALAMGLLVLVQNPFMPESAGLSFVTQLSVKVITSFVGITVWIFAVCLLFSQYQLQGAAAGLPLFLLIVASNARKEMVWAGWIATGLYIAAFWFLAGSQFDMPLSSSQNFPGGKYLDSRALQDCAAYFDGWWQKDAALFNNGLGGAGFPAAGQTGQAVDAFLPWNRMDTGRWAAGSHSRYYGYCKQEWQGACSFFFVFFLIAAFTNLACLTFTMLEVPSSDIDVNDAIDEVSKVDEVAKTDPDCIDEKEEPAAVAEEP